MLSTIINLLVMPTMIYVFYATGNTIYTLVKVSKNDYDELERKAVFDSLAYAMIVILIMVILDMIVIAIFGPNPSINILYGIVPKDLQWIFILDVITSYCFTINIIYSYNKYKYGLSSKKQFYRIIFITAIYVIYILYSNISGYINT